MKKHWKLFVFFALLCLLCLGMAGTAGAWTCSTHWVECDNPGVCDFCGATGLEVPVEEMHHSNYVYVDIGAEHQRQCACGYEVRWTGEHYTYCDAPTTCQTCELEITDPANIRVSHSYGYGSLGAEMHQYCCTICGYAEDPPSEHFADCSDPTVCTICGEANLSFAADDIMHDYVFENLGDTHKGTCSRCGNVYKYTDHWSWCTDPAVCVQCGATGVSAAAVSHYDIRWVEADGGCKEYCSACGKSGEVYIHVTTCNAPTTCYYCGTTGLVGEKLWHWGPYNNAVAETSGHSYDCGKCGVHVTNEVHNYRSGVCSQCGHKESAAPARTPGDANEDGAVDIFDALEILQYSVGWGNAINQSNADVNADGACDIFDALSILQYTVGWDVELK